MNLSSADRINVYKGEYIKNPNHRLRRLLSSGQLLFQLLLIIGLSACGGDSGSIDATTNSTQNPSQPVNPGTEINPTLNPGTSQPATESGFSETLSLRGTVQDVWTIDSLSIVETNGETREISDLILSTYADALGEAFEISSTASFREIAELSPRIIAESGIPRPHIDVVAGQLTYNENNVLLVVATPDVTKGGLVTLTDRLHLDLTRLETQIRADVPVSADYYFAVTTPGDTTDQASTGIELLAERLQAGRFTLQSESPDPDSEPLLLQGNIGKTISGSLMAGLPPKSMPLVCGLPSPPTKPCGVFCLGSNLKDIYQGFATSWTALDANFGPGTGVSPSSPTCDCPPGSDCSSGGNDPHLRSFDGVALSPQAVGEFDAIEYQGANQSIRTQFRFSAVPGNRTVSYITQAALEIDGTRITVAPNRDPLLELDGQAISFNDMGTSLVNGAAFDNSGGINITRSSGGVRIATAGWIWNFSFSARGTDGTRFINFLISAPGDADGIRGLLGTPNNDNSDDLQSRDGSFVIAPRQQPTVEEFYQSFVDTWRIDDATSLFDYAAGESTATYTDFSFPDFPNLVNGGSTPLHIAITNPSVDTTQAETVCKLAGLSSDPSFTECVTDVVNTGDFEIANMNQLLSAFETVVLNKRFGEAIDGRHFRWWHSLVGSTRARDGDIVTSPTLTLVTTATNETSVLNAFDTNTGQALWQFDDITEFCEPTVLDGDRVVAQSDTTGEMILINANTGLELNRIGPAERQYPTCSDELAVTTEGRIILASRFSRYGFSVNSDVLTEEWVFNHETDPLTAGASPRGYDVVLNDDLYFTASKEGNIVVYRVDTATGVAVAEFVSNLTSDDSIQVAGDNLLVLSGSRGGIPAAFGMNADPGTTNLSERWSREFVDTVADRITSSYNNIAVGPNGFASWTGQIQDDGSTRSGIAQFDPQTGLATWFAQTTSFDNNDQIVALPDGGFAVSPFGSANFVEAYGASGNFAWSIPYGLGLGFPTGMATTGANSMVVVSRNGDDSSRTAIVYLGTLR